MAQKERFLSLDVFRGLTICLMIVVNSPGTGAPLYGYLVHAPWFGFTLADLVFPSFLFAVGNAMSFSMPKLIQGSNREFWPKVLKRSAVIFLLGYLMYWYPFFNFGDENGISLKPISETRIMGVLQRIALCYLFASIAVKYLSIRSLVISSAIVLLAYWGILISFGEPGAELEMATNAATKFDLAVLGYGHIYKKDAIPFDPEGVLSTLPSIVNVVAGYLAGILLRRKGKTFETVSLLLVAGFILTSLALWWDLVFPISKKLWTSPFALYTIGLDLSILAVLIFWIEIRKHTNGAYFFEVFGKNPLAIYLFSEIVFITLRLIPANREQDLFEWTSEAIFQKIFPGSFGSFLTGICFMLLCWLVGWWMDRKKCYVRI